MMGTLAGGNVIAPRGAAGRVGKIVLGLIFVVCSGAFGALLGGAYVRFLMPPAHDGWTGIAKGLGGLMAGGLIAIVVASFLAVPLARRGTRALALGAAVSLGAAGLVFLALYLGRPNRPSQDAYGDGDRVEHSPACAVRLEIAWRPARRRPGPTEIGVTPRARRRGSRPRWG